MPRGRERQMKNRTVAYEPASSPLVYLIDGCTLNYPLAKAKTRKALHSYKRPHRVPTVLRPIERARPSQLMDTETMGDVIDLPDARGKVFATGRSTRPRWCYLQGRAQASMNRLERPKAAALAKKRLGDDVK